MLQDGLAWSNLDGIKKVVERALDADSKEL